MLWRLHREDNAEAGLALRNSFVGLGSVGQLVGLNNRFDFSSGYVIEGFIEVFRAVLPPVLAFQRLFCALACLAGDIRIL